MVNLITIQDAVSQIKESIETAIMQSGTQGKTNLIRSQKPIKLLHEVVKAEFIRNKVNPNCLNPPLDQSSGEFSLAGFFKRKAQDICIVPNGLKPKSEKLNFSGILYGQDDKFGFDYTEKTLSINVRSQLSSSAKNFDTLYERTFAEALNLHLRCPKMVLGEIYMIAVKEYDSNAANENLIEYKKDDNVAEHIEKYLLSFSAINNRILENEEYFKYERICLLVVDFSKEIPKIYNTDAELKADNFLPANSRASIENLSFPNFIADLLEIYSKRFGTGKFT